MFYLLKKSSIYAINSTWINNVFTQTCGHYVHFDCYFEYLKMKKQQLHDYSCPLCAQAVNALLPIMSFMTNNIHSESYDIQTCLTDATMFNQYCNSYSTNESVLSALKEEFVVDTPVSFFFFYYFN